MVCYRVTQHLQAFRRLMDDQRIPGFWGIIGRVEALEERGEGRGANVMPRSNILVKEENGREQMMGDSFGVESWNNDSWLSTTVGRQGLQYFSLYPWSFIM